MFEYTSVGSVIVSVIYVEVIVAFDGALINLVVDSVRSCDMVVWSTFKDAVDASAKAVTITDVVVSGIFINCMVVLDLIFSGVIMIVGSKDAVIALVVDAISF